MRALSIGQPHAEAIMRGVKPIEFRSRSSPDIFLATAARVSQSRFFAPEAASSPPVERWSRTRGRSAVVAPMAGSRHRQGYNGCDALG